MRNQAEQAQARPKILRPFRGLAEAFRRRGRNVQAEGGLNNQQIALAQRDTLNTYDPMRDQAFIDRVTQDERQRMAREPKITPELIEYKGQMLTGLEYFNTMITLIVRLGQEAAERGDTLIDYSQLPPGLRSVAAQPLQPLVNPTSEQRRERNLPYVQELDFRMRAEANSKPFSEMAEVIQEKIWTTQSSSTLPVTIKPVGQLKLSIKDDGTVVNRSRYGVTLSYEHRDDVLHIPQAAALSYGIGYVTDRAQLIPEAQALVSDEELKKGVKVYFIQRDYTFGRENETYISAIPFKVLGYQKATEELFNRLVASAMFMNPERLAQEERRTRRAA